MSWVRIDDGFTSNSKVVQLTDREFRIWMRVLCHCGRSQDPTIDKGTMAEVAGLTSALVKKLANIGLTDAVGDAWEVHNWPRYQPKDATAAERQSRWRARRRVTDRVTPSTVTPAVTNGVTEPSTSRAGTRGFPSRPVPKEPSFLPSVLQDPGDGRTDDELEELAELTRLRETTLEGMPE